MHYTLADEAILSLIQSTINTEYIFLVDGIYNRDEHPEQIILYVDNDVMYRDFYKLIRRKKNWSKVRKLSYILDLLDLRFNWKEIENRHFLNLKNYKKYFNEFVKDQSMEKELIKKTFMSCSDYCKEIDGFVEQLIDLRSEYLKMSDNCIKALNKYLSKEFYIDPKLRSSFLDIIYNIEPLFPYIKHLVPDKEWRHIRKKEGNDFSVNKTEEIKLCHQSLVLLLKKTKSLQDTVLPIHMLEDYWDSELWNGVMDSDPRAIETKVKKALALRYDCEVHYIEDIIWRNNK
jgi:hypothetical protein